MQAFEAPAVRGVSMGLIQGLKRLDGLAGPGAQAFHLISACGLGVCVLCLLRLDSCAAKRVGRLSRDAHYLGERLTHTENQWAKCQV